MKKIKSLCLLSLSLLFLSCSNNESNEENSLKVDYKIDLGFVKDLTINTDNNVYAISVVPSTNVENIELQKITSDGKITKLYNQDSYYYQNPKLANDSSGKLFWTTDNLSGTIYSFSNDYLPFGVYTFQGADQMNLRMNGICSLNDNTLVVYDDGEKKFKRYNPNSNTETAIAGSDNYAMIDGNGLNAGFLQLSNIKSYNNVIYAIDSNQYIRKIDCNSADFMVSTIYNLYYETIVDFAIDSNEDIYAIVQNKGIYKLSNGNYAVFKDGTENIKTINDAKSSTIDWTKFNRIFIKNNDMYLISSYGTLTKISDFKDKL